MHQWKNAVQFLEKIWWGFMLIEQWWNLKLVEKMSSNSILSTYLLPPLPVGLVTQQNQASNIKHRKRSMDNDHASQQLKGEKWFSEKNFLLQQNLTETREKFSLKNFSHKNLGGLCQPLSWQQGEIFHPEMLKQLTSQRNTYWLNTPKDGK